jgi:DnaJ-class molecular chaperone
MGLFERISRLARAELNHLLDGSEPDINQPDYHSGDDAWSSSTRPSAERPTRSAREPTQRELDFAALELDPSSDQDAIRKAYRRLLKRYHPDRFNDDPEREAAANELTRRLREAYERLSR